MRALTSERIPILVWGDDIDESTLAQTRNLANLPFAFHHIALMPDAHVGFGMPIGGVLAADGQVLPHAVGLDIGCGVRAWRTGIDARKVLPRRDEILHDLLRSIPTGFEWHRDSRAGESGIFDDVPDSVPLRHEIEKAARQLGTLGGGNHFAELSVDPDGIVWVMLHSGSRNVGKQMAEHYDAVARESSRTHGSEVPPEWGLAHLDIHGDEGREYLGVMEWCLRFARDNRRIMAKCVGEALARHFPDYEPSEQIDVHHNYAAVETHLGREVVVHRKGAVRAVGQVAIPGSMGTASYIGRGLDSPESFGSCSHGAGRTMGRKQAMRTLSRDDVLADLERRDVVLGKVKKRDIAEEAPQAYKDIEDVMAHQRDLVEPVVRLTPIGVVKG